MLIAGVTTRALAVSAARAGHRVSAIDAFGDLDLRAVAEVIPAPRRLGLGRGAMAAAAAGAQVPASEVAYTSNFENYPPAVARLAAGRQLLGNPPDVLARVRNPIELMRVLRRHGIATPEARATASPATPNHGPWLLKPRRSGGGHAIRVWRRGDPVSRRSYLQQWIAGYPGSIVFASDGSSAVPLGFSRQLVGEARLGAHNLRYCGSLLGSPAIRLFPQQDELLERTAALATLVAREFQLVGLNGIDFIARGGVPYAVEVNPRYSASMELVERGQGISMYEVHAGACRGVLPPNPTREVLVQGKAIVFARHDITVGETRHWVGDVSIADVPHPDERIRRGHPICTVFAQARDGSRCRRLLLKRAAAIYRSVESRRRRAA